MKNRNLFFFYPLFSSVNCTLGACEWGRRKRRKERSPFVAPSSPKEGEKEKKKSFWGKWSDILCPALTDSTDFLQRIRPLPSELCLITSSPCYGHNMTENHVAIVANYVGSYFSSYLRVMSTFPLKCSEQVMSSCGVSRFL